MIRSRRSRCDGLGSRTGAASGSPLGSIARPDLGHEEIVSRRREFSKQLIELRHTRIGRTEGNGQCPAEQS